jgi:hypothetical protein
VLAVAAAELGAGVRVGVLVPADVAEVAPAQRRRVLPSPALVGLHARAPPRSALAMAAAAAMMGWEWDGESARTERPAATPFRSATTAGFGFGFGFESPAADCGVGGRGLWL